MTSVSTRAGLAAAVALALAPGVARSQTPDGPGPSTESPLTLEQALDLASASNKTIAAARLRQAVDKAGLEVARERPNPDLRYERAKETPHDALTAVQPLEISGKRGRRIDLAKAVVQTGEAETARIVAETRGAVRRAFYALAAAQRRMVITRESQALADRARAAAKERFDVGDVARLDVLQAELVSLAAGNEAGGLAGELRAARSELNALLGRAPEAPTAIIDDLETAAVPETDLASAEDLAANASVRQLDREIAEAQARVALARAQQMPDPTLEAAVTHDAPGEFVYGYRAAIGIAIPLFTRHRGTVHVEEATLARLQLERQALADRLRGALAAARARAQAQREAYVRFRTEILPRAQEVDAMAEDSYRSGHTGLVALLQSLQATRDVRTKAVQAAFDFQSALADLEQARVVGLK